MRSVTGRLAGRSFGCPEASKPSRTLGSLSCGRTLEIGSSSASRPCSTCCSAATEVTALVMEAIQKTVSTVMGSVPPAARMPNAPSYTTP